MHNEEGYEDGNPPQGYFPSKNPSGYFTDTNLRIGSLINTVEKGGINAIWRKGGESSTARGDRVIWGHFYASPDDVSWGSSNNPDLFVKIWFDVSGRVDVNFFHVSVPDIEVYSDFPTDGTYDKKGTTILDKRYIRHEYQSNLPLSADAGPDITVSEGYVVMLDGSVSATSDGYIISYFWEQIGGPEIKISDFTAIQPTFTAPEVGEGGNSLIFRLTVGDNRGFKNTDTCIVYVEDTGSGGQTYTNSLGMTFNLIPAGTFMMGIPTDEPERDDNETQHRVTLTKSFYIQ